jgi:LmbE family N-acetylglucosaminyl deacetylase
MAVLGAEVLFLGIPDKYLNERILIDTIKGLKPEFVFAPAVYPKGHPDHNLVGKVAINLWGKGVNKYATYQTNDFALKGDIAVEGVGDEPKLKQLALSKYKSQHQLARVHFEAVKGKPEYYIL